MNNLNGAFCLHCGTFLSELALGLRISGAGLGLVVLDGKHVLAAPGRVFGSVSLEVWTRALKLGTVRRNQVILGRVAGRAHAPALLSRRDDKNVSFCSFLARAKLFLGHRYLLFTFQGAGSAQKISRAFRLVMAQARRKVSGVTRLVSPIELTYPGSHAYQAFVDQLK